MQEPTTPPVEQTPKPPEKPTSWWFFELWYENRELFKEIVKHILIFTILLGVLILVDKLLKHTDFSPERKEALDRLDYYMVVIVLVIFAVSFIIKIVLFEIRGFRQ